MATPLAIWLWSRAAWAIIWDKGARLYRLVTAAFNLTSSLVMRLAMSPICAICIRGLSPIWRRVNAVIGLMRKLANLMSLRMYENDPERAWERLKVRSPKRDYLAALKAVAAWRERTAMSRNIPRRRVLKDDALYVVAQQRPKDIQALSRLRGVPRGFGKNPAVPRT